MATEHDIAELNRFYLGDIKDAKSRGVKVQVLMPAGTPAGELKKFAEVQEVESPLSRAVVSDGQEAMVLFMDPAGVHPTFDAGVWVNSPYVAKTVEKLFEEAWKD